MRLPFLLLFLVGSILGCSPRKEKIPDPPTPTIASNKLIIYQVMTRLFGNTNTTNKPFGTRDENGVGKFNNITDKALSGIRELGVTHVWYTGILEHALMTDYTADGIPLDDPDVIKGRAGSPYSVKDYYDVNPDLATQVNSRLAEFDALVDRTHRADLKVIIDFIPNHVARSYHSDVKPDGVEDLGASDDQSKAFAVDNNFYYLPGQSFKPPADLFNRFKTFYTNMDGKFDETPAKTTGDDQFTATPKIDSWFESIKLNYGVDYQNGRKTYFDSIPATWVKMKDILVYWANRKVDGFRCDMAEMVPVEFWNWAIPQVRAVNPDIVFIAEIYTPARYRDYIERGRFDFLYDKVQLYDTLRLAITGKAGAMAVAHTQGSLKDINRNLVHFLENHDEQRIASPFFAGSAAKGLPGMTVSALIDQGPVLIYFGQEVGEPGAGAEGFGDNDGRTSMFDYWGVPNHQRWMNGGLFDGGQLGDEEKSLRASYAKLLTLAGQQKAIAEGEYIDLTALNVGGKTTSDRIVSFARSAKGERLIVVAGFNSREEPVQIKLTPELAKTWGVTSTYPVKDLLGDTTKVFLTGDQGIRFSLPAFGSRVFRIEGLPD